MRGSEEGVKECVCMREKERKRERKKERSEREGERRKRNSGIYNE